MINSSLLSKIWFIAMHTPASSSVIADLNKQVNHYFRRGKRSNSVSYEKRITPTEFGGLGQLDIEAQINNLLAKWAIKSAANDPHPWNLYWKWNIRELQAHLKTTTHPLYYSCDWGRKRSVPPLRRMIHGVIGKMISYQV